MKNPIILFGFLLNKKNSLIFFREGNGNRERNINISICCSTFYAFIACFFSVP